MPRPVSAVGVKSRLHLRQQFFAVPCGWSANLSATWKAAENDCLERRNSIRPCVPSHVAYKAERGGNEPFWSPWKNVSTRVSAVLRAIGAGRASLKVRSRSFRVEPPALHVVLVPLGSHRK